MCEGATAVPLSASAVWLNSRPGCARYRIVVVAAYGYRKPAFLAGWLSRRADHDCSGQSAPFQISSNAVSGQCAGFAGATGFIAIHSFEGSAESTSQLR
jgi:hypothetical protein